MICAIVFAAGHSRRMGTQKLLLPWGNKTVIAQVVDEILSSTVNKTFVVVAPDGEVQNALGGRDVSFVKNPKAETEMLESLRCGLRVLPADCEAVLVVLGDQPLITSALITQIIRTFRETNHGIVLPSFQGQRGHPMLFSMRFRDEVLRDFDDVGLKGLRARHPDEVFEMPISSPLMFDDIDTPEDYERLRARLNSPASGA
jgi:molybdenum cofactor cytidylyltransferase